MKNQTIIVLKSENAAQEIYCPYCAEEQKINLHLVAHITENNGDELTTCICFKCKKEFVLASFNCIFFETSKLSQKTKGAK